MKIVCDSCSTKYSISDDKVRGKVFKIRCKKCSHIIVVKGTTEAPPAAPETPTDAVWHLVVDGDQVGPLTDGDVRTRLARNEITAENYVWKEGFADWLRLAEVPEFGDVVSSDSSSSSYAVSAPVTGDLFSDSGQSNAADATEVADRDAGMGGFMGSMGVGNEGAGAGDHAGFGFSSRRNSSAHAPLDDDGFSASAGGAAASEAADLFGAVVPVAARVDSGRVRGRGSNGAGQGQGGVGAGAGRHDGGRIENLTAQRSENSVLFSLSNLQSLAAAPAPTTKPGAIQSTEGSGLIDIRAMAASTMRAPSPGGVSSFGSDSRIADDDLPAFGAFSSAAPVLLSLPTSSGPPKWLYLLLALIAVLIVAVGVAAFSILGKPVIVEQPAAPVAPTPDETPTPKQKAAMKTSDDVPSAASSKPIADGDLPPREGGDTASAPRDKGSDKADSDKSGAKGPKGAKGKGKRAGTGAGAGAGDNKAGSGTTVASAGAAAPAAEPEKAKPAKGSLDDLLEGALNGRKAKPKVDDDAPAAKKGSDSGGGGNAPLTKTAVVAGMNGVKGKVSACYAQFKVPGMAMVSVVIAKSGKVTGATVTGKFAGTPTGTCVENAVKTASFPPSEGLSTPYPFSLR